MIILRLVNTERPDRWRSPVGENGSGREPLPSTSCGLRLAFTINLGVSKLCEKFVRLFFFREGLF
jgi:hypothetical protein